MTVTHPNEGKNFWKHVFKKKKKQKKEREKEKEIHKHRKWSGDLLKVCVFFFPPSLPFWGITVYPRQPQTKGTGQVLEASEQGTEEAREERSMIDGVLVGL